MERIYSVGERLKILDFTKEFCPFVLSDYCTITKVNEKNKIYHWSAKMEIGNLLSGYKFDEAILYTNPKIEITEYGK